MSAWSVVRARSLMLNNDSFSQKMS